MCETFKHLTWILQGAASAASIAKVIGQQEAHSFTPAIRDLVSVHFRVSTHLYLLRKEAACILGYAQLGAQRLCCGPQARQVGLADVS